MKDFKLFDIVKLKNFDAYKKIGVPEGKEGTIIDVIANENVCTVEFSDSDGVPIGSCLSEYFSPEDLILVARKWTWPSKE